MATETPHIATQKDLAFIDFEFVLLNHKDITQNIVSQALIEGMTCCLSTINIKFDNNKIGLIILSFKEKANKRRVNGWFKCPELERDKFLAAMTKILTSDKTVSKIISSKTKIKRHKIGIGGVMLKYSNDFDISMPSFQNTQSIPDKYLKTESFRSKSINNDHK